MNKATPCILELKIMAREKGVKYFSSMSKKKLYEAMKMEEPEKPTKVELTNRETGEVLKFTSVYKASKELGINTGLLYNYTKKIRVGAKRSQTADFAPGSDAPSTTIYDVKLYNYTKKKRG